MSYLFFKDINQEEFDEFVKNREYCNLLQSYNWAKVKSNWDHMYTGVYRDNVLVATGLVLIKRLPLSFCMYYYLEVLLWIIRIKSLFNIILIN